MQIVDRFECARYDNSSKEIEIIVITWINGKWQAEMPLYCNYKSDA